MFCFFCINIWRCFIAMDKNPLSCQKSDWIVSHMRWHCLIWWFYWLPNSRWKYHTLPKQDHTKNSCAFNFHVKLFSLFNRFMIFLSLIEIEWKTSQFWQHEVQWNFKFTIFRILIEAFFEEHSKFWTHPIYFTESEGKFSRFYGEIKNLHDEIFKTRRREINSN